MLENSTFFWVAVTKIGVLLLGKKRIDAGVSDKQLISE
jgi:hypothetical protein